MDSTSFTFLATVLVLVLLSVSLVLRSYILRRRYRQRFQQALADGVFVDLDRNAFTDPGQFDPFGAFRRSTRRLGPKPVLSDIRIRRAHNDTWSSIMPVAVYSTSSLSPSTLIPPPQSFAITTSSTPSPQAQRRPSFFSRRNIQRPFSFPFRFPRLFGQPHAAAESPIAATTRSAPPQPGSSGVCACTDKDAATLSICVLVAMPDASAPLNRPPPDPKGKGVDPLESQAHHPQVPQRSGPGMSDFAEHDGLPSLEFGVVEVKTRVCVCGV